MHGFRKMIMQETDKSVYMKPSYTHGNTYYYIMHSGGQTVTVGKFFLQYLY